MFPIYFNSNQKTLFHFEFQKLASTDHHISEGIAKTSKIQMTKVVDKAPVKPVFAGEFHYLAREYINTGDVVHLIEIG